MEVEKTLLIGLQQMGLPCPEAEFRFSNRGFRFDFAYPEQKLAIEIEGQGPRGLGRHQRPGGFERDLGKYNLAAALGWRLLRFTPKMIRQDPMGCARTIKEALDYGKTKGLDNERS